MNVHTLTTSDAIALKYACDIRGPEYPWIVLILPFGLDAAMARPFFEFFRSHYNLCTWESRCILEDSAHEYSAAELSIHHHVNDMLAVMATLQIDAATLVGYCSGAGIALASLDRAPGRFPLLVLAHGEYALLHDPACVTPFAADMDGLLSMAAANDRHAQTIYDKIKAERFGGANRPAGLDRPFSDLRFFKRYAQNYLAYKTGCFERLAMQISGRTLLLAGGKDIQVNPESSKKIGSYIRGAELLLDQNADHYGILTPDSNTLITIWNYLCENIYERDPGLLHS